MVVLVDSNILLRFAQPMHPDCGLVERAVGLLRTRGEPLHVMAQNLIEFWTVATRRKGAKTALECRLNWLRTSLAF